MEHTVQLTLRVEIKNEAHYLAIKPQLEKMQNRHLTIMDRNIIIALVDLALADPDSFETFIMDVKG